ncbi:unnamed protein product, partial [marine sediment metagenome]
AALTGDPTMVFRAIAYDPLSKSVLALKNSVTLTANT